jgi:hypothetical protein
VLKPTLLISGALAAIGIFGAGIFVGTHVGVHEFSLIESSARAALLVGELSALRAGATQKLIDAKEIELDGEVVRAMRFQDHGHAWLFWPEDMNYDHNRYLTRVAQYRRQYPAVIPKLEPSGPEQLKAEMSAHAREVQQATDRLVGVYGK